MPAPQDGDTPADRAKYNGNAEVKAFFASGQVRPIRVHSEGTRRALRGHPEATQWPSEALSGHSEGTQKAPRGHAEAIRGDPRALRGTQRPSKGTQRPPLAIIRNQEHSAALSGTPEGTGTQDGHKGHIAC